LAESDRPVERTNLDHVPVIIRVCTVYAVPCRARPASAA
jgi:hypothetical protein